MSLKEAHIAHMIGTYVWRYIGFGFFLGRTLASALEMDGWDLGLDFSHGYDTTWGARRIRLEARFGNCDT